MWKASAGRNVVVKSPADEEDDEWETDPDFVVSKLNKSVTVKM